MNKTMGAFLHVSPDNVNDAASGYASDLIPTLQNRGVWWYHSGACCLVL